MAFMPETLGPALLKYKAIAWRKAASASERGGDESTAARAGASEVEGNVQDRGVGEKKAETVRWRAEIEDESLGVALQRNLKRPFIMLVKEPILIFFSIYLTGKSPRLHSPITFSKPIRRMELTSQWFIHASTDYSIPTR